VTRHKDRPGPGLTGKGQGRSSLDRDGHSYAVNSVKITHMNRPFTIGIGGSQSNVGKTYLVVSLLRYLTKPYVSRHLTPAKSRKWGAIKYTKTGLLPSVVTDQGILMEKGKDTWQMLNAGASRVVWIKSPRSKLNRVLPKTLQKFSGLDGIIIEGNSAIEFLKPDIVIFITGGDKANWKTGTVRILGVADIILYENRDLLPEKNLSTPSFHKNLSDKNEKREFFMAIKKLIDEKKLAREMLKKAVNGKLSCSEARKIAERLNIPYKKVGKTADDLGIRIKDCRLGCF
jgi:molybdopterin-guanine dinucleotide biosynthesis protein